jgi:hypothetical protein
MGTAERELRAAQNQLLFRSVNDRILELGEKLGGAAGPRELDFACECADETCVERITLTASEFGEIEEDVNRFIVLHGHERDEVEDVVAEQDAYLIVAKRGAGAEFVREMSDES